MLASDLKTGTIYKENGSPYIVEKYDHSKSARSGAVVKIRARNLITGQIFDRPYKGSDKVEDASVYKKSAQFLFKENGFIFMDPDTFEQINISKEIVGEGARSLKEGESVIVLYYEDNPVSIELPVTMIFEVKSALPGYKGNTVSNVLKEVVLENGTEVKAPTFINQGDRIKIDTRSGQYISKA